MNNKWKYQQLAGLPELVEVTLLLDAHLVELAFLSKEVVLWSEQDILPTKSRIGLRTAIRRISKIRSELRKLLSKTGSHLAECCQPKDTLLAPAERRKRGLHVEPGEFTRKTTIDAMATLLLHLRRARAIASMIVIHAHDIETHVYVLEQQLFHKASAAYKQTTDNEQLKKCVGRSNDWIDFTDDVKDLVSKGSDRLEKIRQIHSQLSTLKALLPTAPTDFCDTPTESERAMNKFSVDFFRKFRDEANDTKGGSREAPF